MLLHHFNVSLSITIVITMSVAGAISAASPVTAEPSRFLESGIQLNSRLPSLDTALAPGNQFDQAVAENLLKKSSDIDVWVKLPSWAAGQWSQSKSFMVSSKDEKSGVSRPAGLSYMSKSDFSLGAAKDRTGQIWEHQDSGYWTTTELENTYSFAFISSNIPIKADGEICRFKARMVVFNVDKQTKVIKSCQQREAAFSFSYVSPTVMREKEWHQVFDWQGNPNVSANNESNCIKTSAFCVDPLRKSCDGQSLQTLFIAFLKKNGLSSLAPVSTADIEAELNDIQPATGEVRKHTKQIVKPIHH